MVTQVCEHGGKCGVPACDAVFGLFIGASVDGRDVNDEIVPRTAMIQLDGGLANSSALRISSVKQRTVSRRFLYVTNIAGSRVA